MNLDQYGSGTDMMTKVQNGGEIFQLITQDFYLNVSTTVIEIPTGIRVLRAMFLVIIQEILRMKLHI